VSQITERSFHPAMQYVETIECCKCRHSDAHTGFEQNGGSVVRPIAAAINSAAGVCDIRLGQVSAIWEAEPRGGKGRHCRLLRLLGRFLQAARTITVTPPLEQSADDAIFAFGYPNPCLEPRRRPGAPR